MSDKKSNTIMKRVDTLLVERNITQRELCNAIGVSSPALSGLRKTNGMPSADTALKISSYFSVAPEWLIFGKIILPKSFDNFPSEILNRIDKLLKDGKVETFDHFMTYSTILEFYSPILNIITVVDILNWHNNRCFPEIDKLLLLAKYFNKSFEYIVQGYEPTGVAEKTDDNVEIVPKDEYKDYCRFKEYKYFMYSYDCLYKPDKKYVSAIVQRLFRLRRKIEKRDFDPDYIRNHPGEENPPELDPDISDEEYAEMRKKDSHL